MDIKVSNIMYITKADRENIILLVGLEGALIELEKEWVKHKRPKEWLKSLRTAKTWLGKTNDSIANTVSDEEKKRTYKMLNKYQVILIPNSEAKQYMERPEMISLHSDVLGNLSEAVLESQCQNCRIDDYKVCKYRNALMDASIPAFDANAKGCQYKY